MREQGWQTDEFGAAHEGRVGVVLADGTAPNPVEFDTGSGSNVHQSTDWRRHDGSWEPLVKAPRAEALRAVCSCGWQGDPHPVAELPALVAALEEAAVGAEDGAGPRHPWKGQEEPKVCERDWAAHVDEVERAAVPLPEDVTLALARIADLLEALAGDEPLVALRAVRQLQSTVELVGGDAASLARRGHDLETIGRALGLPEKDARNCLSRYARW